MELHGSGEPFASAVPLILVLEDLHWSDPATVDLLSALTRQTRLTLIGTIRPVEMVIVAHALRTAQQDMEVKRLWRELPLNFLTEEGVARYLDIRFGAGIVSREAAREIHRRTDHALPFPGEFPADRWFRGTL